MLLDIHACLEFVLGESLPSSLQYIPAAYKSIPLCRQVEVIDLTQSQSSDDSLSMFDDDSCGGDDFAQESDERYFLMIS